MSAASQNPFQHLVEPLDPSSPQQKFYNLSKLEDPRYGNECSWSSTDLTAGVPETLSPCRAPAVLHPGPPGVCRQELRRVPREALRRGKCPELEADADSDCGGSLQTGAGHPAGLHVRYICYVTLCDTPTL